MSVIARRRFRPKLWPTLFTIPALIVLVGLGTWQVERLHWKESLIAERQSRSKGPAIALPAEIADAAALEFYRVRVTGRFLHDRELYLGARSHRGRVGYNVITPMALEDGRTILVNRGWVPGERKAPENRAEAQIEAIVALEGLLRTGGWKGYDFVRPDNRPEENFWFWIDLPAMAAHAGLKRPVTALYVDAGPAENPGGFPIGGQTRIDLPNDHLEYAIIWYALAVALLVIYLLSQSHPADPNPGDARL